MKNLIILMVILSQTLGAEAGDKIRKHMYIDGNNNKYTVIKLNNGGKIIYDPVTKAESSSGEYSGGEPWEIHIPGSHYKSVTDLLSQAVKDKSQLNNERSMGSGTIIFPNGKVYYLKMNSENKRKVDEKLREMKDTYGVKPVVAPAGDTVLVLGKIEERNFVSKRGEQTDIKEFYFVPVQIKDSNYKEDYFVKLSKGKVTRDELKKYIGKEIEIKGMLLRGLWDADDNTVQSRYGDYVIILEILK